MKNAGEIFSPFEVRCCEKMDCPCILFAFNFIVECSA